MTQRQRILVTGANGFVGARLCSHLAEHGRFDTVGSVRSSHQSAFASHAVGDLDSFVNWKQALAGRDVVIHTAARAHIMKDDVADPASEYRIVNVEATVNLARQAVDAGVRRFIFISSIKVNGEGTSPGQPFTSEDKPKPEDLYGMSKLEAEQRLQALATESGMEVVIIRPPLVFGPSVKGNFASMIKLVESGLPLPFGAIHNKRSLVALDNLVDLIITCIDHPDAANQVFLVSDGADVSTTELLREVACALGRPSRLMPVPAGLLRVGATALGKKAMAQRLLGSLQVDISKARTLLGWQPPLSFEEGLRRCVGHQ